MIEWTRLPALILVIVSLLLWWLNRSRGQPVQIASTEIWQRIAPSRVRPPLVPLFIALLLSLAAAAPIIMSPPSSISMAIDRDDQERFHLEVLADVGESGAEVVASFADTPIARGTLEAAAGASAVTLPLPSVSPGDTLSVSIGSRSHSLEVPHRAPLRVTDLSDCPQIANGLEALELAGRIERVSSDAEIAFLRGDIESDVAKSIRLPAVDSEITRFFVGHDPHLRPSDLVAGLRWQAWTVLEATAIGHGDQVLIPGDDGTPLLISEKSGARFAFDPARSNLPQRAGWPVLLGRLIEELSVGPAPPLQEGRILLPALLAALALLLSMGATTGWRRWTLMSVIVAAALAPILAPAPAVHLSRWDERSLLDLSLSLAPGSTIAVDSDRPVPCAISSPEQLRQRGISVSITETPPASLVIVPSRVLPGQPVRISSSLSMAMTPLEIWQNNQKVGILDVLPTSWTPTRSGFAFIHSPSAGISAGLVVDPPVTSTVLAPDRRAGNTLLPSPVFISDHSDNALPQPPTGSAIIWNGDPLSVDEAQQLENWLKAGGTLLAVAAPPYLEDSRERQLLDRMLPAPLPTPPPPPVEDHGVLLLDLSGSLSGSGARILLAGTIALLEGTPTGGRWGILGFRDSTRWLVPPGTPIDNSAIDRIRTDVRTGGGTRLDVAIEEALGALQREGQGRALVVVSDGRSEPADWSQIGSELKAAGVKLHFVAVGELIDRSVIESLTEAAAGRWHHATDARKAVSLLGDAITARKGDSHPVKGDLRPASIDVLVDGSPRRLPGPPQRIAISETHPDSRTLWVDEEGSPLLLGRSVGSGTSLMWLTGVDDESLGSAAELIRDAISTLLLDATRGKLVVAENARWSRDEKGRSGLLVDCPAGSPAVLEYRLTSARGDLERSIGAALLPGRGRFIPVETGEEIGWIGENSQEEIIAAALPAHGQIKDWRRWLHSEGLGEKRWPPPNPVLLAMAVIVALLPRRR